MVQVAKLERQRQRRVQGQEPVVVDVAKYYARWIGWIVGGIALVIAAILLYHQSQQQDNEQALTALSRILPYFEQGEYQKALEGDPQRRIRGEPVIGLRAIVEEYAATPAGKIAALFAGAALAYQGKWTDAQYYYEIAAESDNVDVHLGGMGGEAAAADAAFHYADASDLWQQVAQEAKSRGEYQRFLLYSAQLAEVAGETQKAAQLYREIILTTPFSYYAGFAKSGLVRIGEDVVPRDIE